MARKIKKHLKKHSLKSYYKVMTPSSKFILILIAISALIISGAFIFKNYYQRSLSKTVDFSFYSQPEIPDFLQGYVEKIGKNFITVKDSNNKIINLNLVLPTEVKILLTATPSTATPSARVFGSLTKPAYRSTPIMAKITDLKVGDTVSILLTKDAAQKVIKQEITIIK